MFRARALAFGLEADRFWTLNFVGPTTGIGPLQTVTKVFAPVELAKPLTFTLEHARSSGHGSNKPQQHDEPDYRREAKAKFPQYSGLRHEP